MQSTCIENQLWVVSANSGGIINTSIPADSTNGGSQVLDHRGLVLVEAGVGENMTACANIASTSDTTRHDKLNFSSMF